MTSARPSARGVALVALLLGTGACSAAADPECSGPAATPAAVTTDADGVRRVDLAVVPVQGARDGCEIVRAGEVVSPEGQAWLRLGLSETGDSVVAAYEVDELPDPEAGGPVPGSAVGAVSKDGRVRWLRESAEAPAGQQTWLADVSDRWVLWADGTSEAGLSTLDATFWSADRRSGAVHRLGATAQDRGGLSRSVAGYNRPTIVGTWAFWVDAVLDERDAVRGAHVLGAPLDGSAEPREVSAAAYMLTADDCSAAPTVAYVDPGLAEDGADDLDPEGGELRLLRRAVTDEGWGAEEVVATLRRPSTSGLTDVGVCGETVAWSVTSADDVEADTADDGEVTLGTEPSSSTSVLWVQHGDVTTALAGAPGSSVRDVGVGPDAVVFTLSGPDGTARHLLYRWADDVVVELPTQTPTPQMLRASGSYVSWMEPAEGRTAEEAMMDVQHARTVVARVLPAAADG